MKLQGTMGVAMARFMQPLNKERRGARATSEEKTTTKPAGVKSSGYNLRNPTFPQRWKINLEQSSAKTSERDALLHRNHSRGTSTSCDSEEEDEVTPKGATPVLNVAPSISMTMTWRLLLKEVWTPRRVFP